MKIISWNMRNLGTTKLTNTFTNTFQALGLGNNVQSYMINVVMGSQAWTNINPAVPADIFVIIELKCGGNRKGYAATGAAVPVLQAVTGAMNTVVANTQAYQGNYQYSYVNPLIVGRHEAVGIIYNTKALTLNQRGVLRDNNLRLINPRSPFWARFTHNNGTVFNVIGIHAPPPSGGANVRYRNPINFARKVSTVPDLVNANTMVMGDYNCAPNSVYNSGQGNVGWTFNGYQTNIPNGTLTSVRKKVAKGQTPPANYLSGPYDNLLRNFNGNNITQGVLDTIGNARNVNTNPPSPPGTLAMVLNNYNKVSDHLPLSMY